jgi:hypothetical protein
MKELNSELLFEEVQSRTSRQTIVIFRTVSIIVLIALVINLVLQNGVNTAFTYFLITLLTVLVALNLILPSNLTTQIRNDGIYVRFPPFQPAFTKFFWADIAQVYVRNYDAMMEYFGWGYRISPNGIGYIVRGNTGIQIILKSGNKILITTQKPDEVNEVLKRIEMF